MIESSEIKINEESLTTVGDISPISFTDSWGFRYFEEKNRFKPDMASWRSDGINTLDIAAINNFIAALNGDDEIKFYKNKKRGIELYTKKETLLKKVSAKHIFYSIDPDIRIMSFFLFFDFLPVYHIKIKVEKGVITAYSYYRFSYVGEI